MASAARADQLRFSGLAYSDKEKCLIDADGTRVPLRAKSLAVFRHLADRAGTVVSKEELLNAVWSDVAVTDDSLTQCIADIRRVLGESRHDVLKTVPRQGYILIADPAKETDKNRPSAPASAASKSKTWLAYAIFGLGLMGIALFVVNDDTPLPVNDSAVLTPIPENPDQRASSVALRLSTENVGNAQRVGQRFASELEAILTRYRTIRLVGESSDAQYRLDIQANNLPEPNAARVLVKAVDTSTDTVFMSRDFDITDQDSLRKSAIRTAAFASPAGGALSRHLMNTAIRKPVEKLTRAECFAHAYNCTTCAGRIDNISERSQACLADILARDPQDSTAWALKAALHTHQYRFGSATPEPERSNLQARSHYPKLAVEAAMKAESLSDGFDTAVYWGMALAYGSTCEPEKLQTAVRRGLQINPYDPSLMAVFGNWLAFSGFWDQGVALVEKAIEIEPEHNRHWWLFGGAKRHYYRGEYEQAYQAFVEAFNEDNWISHVQLAYTLPHLDRLADARAALKTAKERFPGLTLEKVLQSYRVNCFPDKYLEKIRAALTLAGLPSRGKHENLSRVETVPAKLATVNGTQLEYMDIGEGEPIVFVHGGFADYRAWGYFEVPISEKYRFISYSQRLYGTRPWPEKINNLTLDDYAADLAAFIEYLDVGPVHIVTWSMGGHVAALTSLRRPELFKSVIHFEPYVLSMAAGDPELGAVIKSDYQQGGPRLSEFRRALQASDEQTAVEKIYEIVSSQEPGAFHRETAGTQRVFYDNARMLPLEARFKLRSDKLTCDGIRSNSVPTLLIHGENSIPHMIALTRKFESCLPNAHLAVIPEATHNAPIRKVDELVKLISEFVEENR